MSIFSRRNVYGLTIHKHEIDGDNEQAECEEVIPVQGLAAEKQDSKDGEDH